MCKVGRKTNATAGEGEGRRSDSERRDTAIVSARVSHHVFLERHESSIDSRLLVASHVGWICQLVRKHDEARMSS